MRPHHCIILSIVLASCSTVSHLPEGELLYTGTKHIHIEEEAPAPLNKVAIGEAKVAFVSPPNNAILGSSRYRTPLPLGLWVYNAFVDDSTGLKHWLFKSFAATPILISSVNPSLHAEVASNTLRNYGYFDNQVTYHIDTLRGGRKASLSYTLLLGHPWHYDTVKYLPFPHSMDSLLQATWHSRLLREGEQFSYSSLVGERNRLFTLFREHGYYYFRSDMLLIQADTTQHPHQAQLRIGLQPALADYALKPWYIGHIDLNIEGGAAEPAIRHSITQPRITLHRGQLYSATAQDATQHNLNRLGVFNSVSLSYVPRDSSMHTDTLDVYITALLEKPRELTLEANLTGKSNNQVGPGIAATLSRKNLLRMAETIQLQLKGSYEWQTNRALRREGSVVNSFELGAEALMSVPTVLIPHTTRREAIEGSSSVRLYVDWLNRGGFFRMLAFGGNLTYAFSSSDVLTHSLTPSRLTFNKLERTTHRFDSIMTANPIIGLSFRNQFIPAASYTLTYDNTARQPRHPRKITLSLTSAGAVTSLVYAAAGYPLSGRDKTLMHTPFAQFIKGSVEACRYFHLAPKHVLATRFTIGAVHPYANSRVAPFSEQFYVGGANDLRAFPLRSIGPGSYHSQGRYAYIDHTGEFKLEANIEWRFPIAKLLHGALFADAGNVWLLRPDAARPGADFRWDTFAHDIAVGTGIGLRYNLKVLLLRADIGIPIHMPYTTDRHGYYNVPHFIRSLCYHLAVGYPF
ncbi:MAG: BamA/TamA family outer membrane protein [Bacteroidaceae bacterium]|nr:BamA/TamA family outer membrane protein [Bacteroidaceae bacterium]